jgi:hypothetical protein
MRHPVILLIFVSRDPYTAIDREGLATCETAFCKARCLRRLRHAFKFKSSSSRLRWLNRLACLPRFYSSEFLVECLVRNDPF